MARRNTIDPMRLVDAAEVVLQVVVEVAERRQALGNNTDWPNPVEIYGTPEAPESLDLFSKHEVEEATAFLMRLGVLERPTKAA